MSCSSAPVTATSRSMPRERGGDRADRLGDGQRVLEQAMAVGVVIALGRRRVPVAGPGRARRRPRSAERAGGGSGSFATSSRRSRSICSTVVSRSVVQVVVGVLAVAGRRGGCARELGAGERSPVTNTTSPGRHAVAAGARRETAGTVPLRSPRTSFRCSPHSTGRPRERGAAWETSFLPQIPELCMLLEDKVACGRHQNATFGDRHRRHGRARARRSLRACSTTAGGSSCPGSSRASSSACRTVTGSSWCRPTCSTRTRSRPWSRWPPAPTRLPCAVS